MSAQAESCELRTLLCASVISVGAIDGSELPMDGGEDSSAKVDASEIGSLLGAPIDPDYSEIKPGDPGVDDAIFYCGVADGDSGIPVGDPSEFIRFNTLFTTDDLGAIDGTDGEKPPVADDVILEDAPPTEDWDPSWAYRSFVTVAGEEGDDSVKVDGDPVGGEEVKFDDSVIDQNLPPVEGWDPSWLYRTLTPGEGDGSEEIIVDQGTGWEDGLGCGVSPDGFVPGDVPSNDFDGNEMPDDFVINAFDPLPLEDDPGKPVDFIIDNGGVLEPVDGEVAVEVDAPPSDPNEEEVHYAFDPLPLDDVVGELVDVVEDGELIPIRTLESSDFDPSVIYFTAAPGGVEVQRTNDAGNVQEESAAPSTVSVPVSPTSSNSLFNSNNGRSSVGIPAGVQANSALGTNLSPTKRNATQRRSATQVAVARQSVASDGLNSLSPLLGGDEAPTENDSPESSVDSQAVESGSIEETVSENGNASSGASGYAANQNVQPRSGRAAMIDRVMAQYAENSFNS